MTLESGSRVPRRPKVAVATFGCKLNQWDTQDMLRSLAAGYDIVDFSAEADVYVVNTCTVTAGSDAQARQLIRRTARAHPGAKLIVTGCYAQRARDELLAIGGVDEVLGNDAKRGLSRLLAERVRPRSGSTRPAHSGPAWGRSRAHLAIQEGCDRGCAYCIVPSVRGPARSHAPGLVLRRVEALLEEGYREIVLTGTYLGDYGADLGERGGLGALLRRLNRLVDGTARLRISSVGPSDVTGDFVEAVADSPSVCRHFHVAFQSGDDEILRVMGRGHGTAEVRRALELINSSFPGCGLGGDVMVGFPGESNAAYSNTVQIVREYPFSYLHVFVYSPRPGTRAAGLRGQVRPGIAAERSRELRGLARRKGLEFASNFVGRRLDVVVESPSGGNGAFEGTSDEYLRVLFEGSDSWKGRLLPVDVDSVLSARRVSGRAAADHSSVREETRG
jgi:threonylcarbamoyladenosine tRNA methylthiotransferase MtaB